MSPEARQTVAEIVRTVIAEDPHLRAYVDKCRRVIGSKLSCQRDVFGDCESCDNPPRVFSTTER